MYVYIYILTNNFLTQIFGILIIYLMLGQVVWKMHKLQTVWEDDACLARGRVWVAAGGDRLSCPAWLSWGPRGDGLLRSGVVVEGALAGTLGPGGESPWGRIRALIPEPANPCGAGERWQPWLDVSHSRLVGEWAHVCFLLVILGGL